MSDATRHQLEEIPPSEIFEDPARFQSRAAYPRDWMDQDLDEAELYNPDFAGVISVWRDPDDEKRYVIDGHRRLRLAKRVQSPVVLVQFLEASTDADAFAKGVELSLAQWVFQRGDKLRWAIESRRAKVDRALHTRWLDPDGESANRLYKFYPDLGRRYSSFPEGHKEAETT
ncbi:MAG: hypothetical protein ACR2NN_29595 [Bryobacteraceae bacterium]